jgi:mRNA interferase HigB
MHVLAKPALVAFWTVHPDAEQPLTDWYNLMRRQTFASFSDLRATFSTADYVGGLTVFNIGGNKYRLIADVRYDQQRTYIIGVLTHAEYDQGRWKRKG